MFVDIHCHLDAVKNASEKIALAEKENVSLIVSNSVDIKSMEKNISLSKRFPIVKVALGIHPSEALSMNEKEIEKAFSFMEKNLKKAIAVGETGLDFKHAVTEKQRELQRELFKRHISLALEFNKPVIVHSRNAKKECINILSEMNAEKILLHWFLGSKKLLFEAIENDWLYSIGPSVFENPAVQKFALLSPLKNMALETDSPVLFNGKPAEPQWIPRIAKKIAKLKKIPLKKVETVTTNNAFRLLGLQQKG